MSQSTSSTSDRIKLVSAGIIVLSGIVVFQILPDEEFITGVAALAVGLLIGFFLVLKSLPGQQFVGFFRDAIHEMRRVVWPTKKETFQTVLIVFVFVLLVSIFLWMADKSFEWILYDIVLGWK